MGFYMRVKIRNEDLRAGRERDNIVSNKTSSDLTFESYPPTVIAPFGKKIPPSHVKNASGWERVCWDGRSRKDRKIIMEKRKMKELRWG